MYGSSEDEQEPREAYRSTNQDGISWREDLLRQRKERDQSKESAKKAKGLKEVEKKESTTSLTPPRVDNHALVKHSDRSVESEKSGENRTDRTDDEAHVRLIAPCADLKKVSPLAERSDQSFVGRNIFQAG